VLIEKGFERRFPPELSRNAAPQQLSSTGIPPDSFQDPAHPDPADSQVTGEIGLTFEGTFGALTGRGNRIRRTTRNLLIALGEVGRIEKSRASASRWFQKC
jgi:hypothetical protein